MENAAEALKMAGFTLLMVAALAISMTTIMQGKQTSEAILKYSNKSNYYSDISINEDFFEKDDNNKITSNRILTVYDIIPTLYRYKQEEYIVLFYNKNEEEGLQIFDGDRSEESNIKNSKYISYLNYYLEDKLQEPWRQNNETVKKHVDNVVNYLIKNHNKDKFVEKLEFTYNKYENNIGIELDSNELENNTVLYNTDDNNDEEKRIRVIKYILME